MFILKLGLWTLLFLRIWLKMGSSRLDLPTFPSSTSASGATWSPRCTALALPSLTSCRPTSPAPFSNCLIQNGDLGGEVELINLPLIFVVYCSNYNGAPVKMVSLSTVPPPPVESETLHGRLEKGALGVNFLTWKGHWKRRAPPRPSRRGRSL